MAPFSCTNLITQFITLPSSICCEMLFSLIWGKFVDTCFIMGGGLPYTILYGEEPWDCGVILSLSRADGSKSTQEQSVFMIHLESLFKCPVGSFHHPRTLRPICCMHFHLMFKVWLTCYTKSATKAGPLSDPMLVGNPNLGSISLSRHQATSDALSVWVGKASTHP